MDLIITATTAGTVPPGQSGTPASRAPPRQALPERSPRWETGDLPSPGTHVGSRGGGVQRTHFGPQDLARGRKRCPPGRQGSAPKRGRRSIQHPKVLRPRTLARRGPPRTSGRGTPRTRGPPESGSPGPGSGSAASPASRTAPARRAAARSASARPAPPRPPSCADATRPRPLVLVARAGPRPGPMGARGWGGRTGAREGQRAAEQSCPRPRFGLTRRAAVRRSADPMPPRPCSGAERLTQGRGQG